MPYYTAPSYDIPGVTAIISDDTDTSFESTIDTMTQGPVTKLVEGDAHLGVEENLNSTSSGAHVIPPDDDDDSSTAYEYFSFPSLSSSESSAAKIIDDGPGHTETSSLDKQENDDAAENCNDETENNSSLVDEDEIFDEWLLQRKRANQLLKKQQSRLMMVLEPPLPLVRTVSIEEDDKPEEEDVSRRPAAEEPVRVVREKEVQVPVNEELLFSRDACREDEEQKHQWHYIPAEEEDDLRRQVGSNDYERNDDDVRDRGESYFHEDDDLRRQVGSNDYERSNDCREGPAEFDDNEREAMSDFYFGQMNELQAFTECK